MLEEVAQAQTQLSESAFAYARDRFALEMKTSELRASPAAVASKNLAMLSVGNMPADQLIQAAEELDYETYLQEIERAFGQVGMRVAGFGNLSKEGLKEVVERRSSSFNLVDVDLKKMRKFGYRDLFRNKSSHIKGSTNKSQDAYMNVMTFGRKGAFEKIFFRLAEKVLGGAFAKEMSKKKGMGYSVHLFSGGIIPNFEGLNILIQTGDFSSTEIAQIVGEWKRSLLPRIEGLVDKYFAGVKEDYLADLNQPYSYNEYASQTVNDFIFDFENIENEMIALLEEPELKGKFQRLLTRMLQKKEGFEIHSLVAKDSLITAPWDLGPNLKPAPILKP